jgi:hypothetical protein
VLLALSLGFFTYVDGSRGELSSALSANTLMAKAINPPHEYPPHQLPLPGPSVAGNVANSGYYADQDGNVNYLSNSTTPGSGHSKKRDKHGKKDDRHEHRHKRGNMVVEIDIAL